MLDDHLSQSARFLRYFRRNRAVLVFFGWILFTLFLYAFGTLVVYLLSASQADQYFGLLVKPKDFCFLYAVLEVLMRIVIGCLSSLFFLLCFLFLDNILGSFRDIWC
ncbi:hypothetical protein ACSSZE_15125 [Acidithiobacillus caldus]